MSQTIGKTRLAFTRTWHHISLNTSPPLGRTASAIAQVLMGKHKPTHDPSADDGDYVVATNCHSFKVTGKKLEQKKYYSHTSRPGSLKTISMEKLMEKWGGAEILKRAVSGMLPKNRLRKIRLERLKAFEGDVHPFKENILKFQGNCVLEHLPVLPRVEKVKVGKGIAEMQPVQQTLEAARK